MGHVTRRDLLKRHMWRTKLQTDPDVAEQAALALCARSTSRADAVELVQMCGLVSPDGPARVQPGQGRRPDVPLSRGPFT